MRVLLLLLVLAGLKGAPVSVAAPDTSAPKDPADAVRKYYAFLEAKDYPRAYAMWGEGGLASKQTYSQFADGFARTAHTRVTVTAPVSIEGAAGSSYAEVRVRVDATTTDGQEQQARDSGAFPLPGIYIHTAGNDA